MKLAIRASLISLMVASSWAQAEDLNLEQLIAKSVEARGGLDELRAVKSFKATGSQNFGAIDTPLTMEWAAPGSIRMEFTVQGMTGIMAFDGSKGWSVMPFMGKTDPEEMAEDQVKNMQEQADFEGPLVDWQKKGHKAELVGKTEIEGTPVWHIKMVRKSGDTSDVYLDAEYYLPIREDSTLERMGSTMRVITTIGDYKEVGNLVLPHAINSRPDGQPSGASITITSYELNVELAKDRFSMPEPAAAVTE